MCNSLTIFPKSAIRNPKLERVTRLPKIKLLLVDDHAIVRAGVRMLLESQDDMEIVGEVETGAAAVAQAKALQPHVILMDISLPDMDGFEATRQIKRILPEAAILALTMHESDEYFFKMLHAGASGYVPKKAAPTDLLTAIRTVQAGQVFLYPSVAKALVRDFVGHARASGDSASLDGLTDREREVLTLIADDLANQEIADKLTISVKTVERHRANIMAKLNLHSRTELVKYAIRKGMIEVEG
ncbi:MAG: response regulator transcription factor [Chloroflexi bacterium]|nr:response regulator transcription factor [Chloroflexota bacterium]